MSNPISAVTSTSGTSNLDSLNAQNGAVGKQTLGQADFFKLLTTQLASQDPLKPMDDMSFISQMASFSSLQQMQTLATNMGDFTKQQSVADANSYLGKTVTVTDASGADVSGVVSSVKITLGVPSLIVNGASYGVDAVSNVTSSTQQTTSDVAK